MNLRSRIYGLIVEAHPAAFRHEFGLEMRLDFEEAVKSHGMAGLYWDAAVSVGRQWLRPSAVVLSDHVPVGARYLLDGRYGAIGGDSLSPFEFGRGMILAVLLFGGLVTLQGHAPAHGGSDLASVADSAKGGFAPNKPTRGDDPSANKDAGRFPSSAGGRLPGAKPAARFRTASELTTADSIDRSGTKAAFDPPTRIGETVAGRDAARSEAQRRMAVIAAGAASVGPEGRDGPQLLAAVTRARKGQMLHATAPLPSFEVVSIRLWHRPPAPPPVAADQPGAPKPVMKVDPGSGRPHALKSARWHSIIPVQVLIATAYNLPPDSKRVTGGPGWLREDIQYEITAKIGDEMFAAMQKMTPAEQQTQMQLMQQSMLAGRFGLKVHFEQREMPMFTLEVAKGGTKLTPAAEGVASRLENFADERGGGLKGTAVTLDQLTQSPLFLGGRVVENKTGLTGAYDFTLRFAGESGDVDSPGLYSALQDQLGLRLMPTKGMVEVLVIDSVDKPSEN